jgi:hypothetical protein
LVERRVAGPLTVEVDAREAPLPYFDKAWEVGNGEWGTGGNWKPGGVPAAGHKIEFVGEESAVVTLGVDRTIGGMTFSKTATTAVASGHSGSSRFINLGSGGLTVNAEAGEVTFTRVPFNVNVDQEWRNNSTSLLTAGSLINVASDSRPTLTVSGPGDLLISGRIAHPDANLWLGALIKSGAGTLTIGDLYAENTTVENGTLLVNGRQDNRLNTSQVTVTSGGTLGGTGILQGPTRVSGNLRPGRDGIGLLTFENSLNLLGGALTTLEIDGVAARGTSYDAINVTMPDGLTFGGELEMVFTGTAELGTYKLFDFAGDSLGELGSVTLRGSYGGSLSQTGVGIWSGTAGGLSFTLSAQSGDLTVEAADETGPQLTFTFADGTLQGWTEAGSDGQGRQFLAVVPPSLNSPNITPHSGDHFIGLHIPAFTLTAPAYTQDAAHDTLVMRSPGFTLNGTGGLSAWLCGGGPGSPGLAGTAVSALPAASVSGGFRGIALRNVNTGQFVLSASKTTEGGSWQQVSFSATQLAALPQDHVYTLDLIDAAHGSWGWVNMDSVTIPGSLVATPDPYLDWAATKGLAGPAAAFDADPDGDGIANGLEFVLGGEPNPTHANWNSRSLLPTAQASGNDLVFTFQRHKQAAYLNPTVEFSAGLVPPWTTAVHGTNATITVTDTGASETITVTLPKNGASRRFARLKVVQAAP